MSTTLIYELKSDINVIAKDVNNIHQILDRYNTTIDKLTDVSNNVTKLIALYSQKSDMQEEVVKDIVKSLEKRRESVDEQIKDLYDKVSEIEKESNDRISEHHNLVMSELNKASATLTQDMSEIKRIMWLISLAVSAIGPILAYIIPAIIPFVLKMIK